MQLKNGNHENEDENGEFFNRKKEIFSQYIEDAKAGKIKYVDKNYKFDFIWQGKQLCSPIYADWKVILNDNSILMVFLRRNNVDSEEILKRKLLNILYNIQVSEID